jgi:GH15 family glucan-1,4-alpha-glucosidase
MTEARDCNLELGVIGNCSFSALIDERGRIVWSCLPQFDSDPVFCSLLDGNGPPDRGFYEIEIADFKSSAQHYIPNTAIIVTELHDQNGGIIQITDFAPRYKRLERIFRPMTIVRHVRTLAGHPRVTVRLRPAHSYGAGVPERTRGSNHIRYVMPRLTLRLTSDAPVSFIANETPFVVDEGFTLILGPDEPLTAPVAQTVHEFMRQTELYWREWSRYLAIPFEWQAAVIRAAITLKLSAFEESGAVVAAMTTSIPEYADSGRNWDYRFCWLRDAYFVVKALNRLGATRTMEDHIRFATNVLAGANGDWLQPVYGIGFESQLTEVEVPSLAGYRGMGPVRRGNQAFEHIQHDVYGSVVLACAQSFFDVRLSRVGDRNLFSSLEELGQKALKAFDEPDAGLWELRTKAAVHTYSAVMCWAAVDRLGRIANHLGMTDRGRYWLDHAKSLQDAICVKAFDAKRNTFVATFGGNEIDASMLLLYELGFINAKDPRFVGTVKAIEAELRHGNHLFRYSQPDDFGKPHTAFTICTFWYIDSLAAIGRGSEAREIFESVLGCRNKLGLLSEDLDIKTGALWGNFPQTYSMVGLINSATALSTNWKDAF